MIIPPRGAKNYKKIWAEEDGEPFDDNTNTTAHQPTTHHAHGSIEQMSEDMAQSDEVSVGPMLARLLQCMRPERRAEPQTNGLTNGDTVMTDGIDGDVTMTDAQQPVADEQQQQYQRALPRRDLLPPATALPEGSMPGANSRAPTNKLSWDEMDERVKQELRYIGFLSEDAEPEYSGHYDDDVAARLRYLQDELQKVSVMNGARKARLIELVEDAQGNEEYTDVVMDLESQLNQAYVKRHRNTAKGKGKLKRAGAAAGYEGTANGNAASGSIGIGRPSMGEGIRELLRRRNEFIRIAGPISEFGHVSVPTESVFNDVVMREHLIREKDTWAELQDS